MFYTNLKMAIRSLWKDRFYASLNLLGLAAGIAVCLLLFSFAYHQQSFDQFHAQGDKIYRLGLQTAYDGTSEKWGTVPNIAGPHFKENIASIVDQTRLLQHNFGRTAFFSCEGKQYAEKSFYWADSSFFDLFSLEIIARQREQILNEPNQIAISASTKQKIFGNGQALGKTIKVDNDMDLEIVAVYSDLPSNSSLQANLIGSLSSLNWAYKRLYWSNASFETFLLFSEGSDVATVQTQIEATFNKAVKAEDQWFSFWLQPLKEIHLYSSDIGQAYEEKPGDIKQVKMMLWLGLVVLLLACFNYINMSTARAQRRLKDIGISKTLGASSTRLAGRFLSETAVLASCAMLLGIILAALGAPILEQIASQAFPVDMFFSGSWLLAIPVLLCGITLLAGAYPAFVLSGFSPKDIFSPSAQKISTSPLFRKGMVISQYIACITLIASSLIFAKQMQFISNKKLGFQPDQVVAVTTAAAESSNAISGLKNAYYALPEVKEVCRSASYPGISTSGYAMVKPGSESQSISVSSNKVGPRFEEVLDLKFLAGRTLTSKVKGDTTVDVVMNKTAVDFLGWSPEEAIGKSPPELFQYPTTIVGVVEDFHFESLHKPIEPYVFNNGHELGWRPYLLVKLNTTDIAGALKKLENQFSNHIPNSAFEYAFLDQELEKLYAGEKRMVKIVLFFTILAILISCLGLIGLTAFNTERRVKEIGIRKVLGATTGNVVWLLSWDLLRLVFIAIILAVPLAWYLTDSWLQGFAYRITPGLGLFLLATVISLIIAIFTTSLQSLKAALVHPSESLKNLE